MLKTKGGGNLSTRSLVSQLQNINVAVPNNDTDQCKFLEDSIHDWIFALSKFDDVGVKNPILWARLHPIRCNFQLPTNGVITQCGEQNDKNILWNTFPDLCEEWSQRSGNTTIEVLSETYNIRVGNIIHTNITDSSNEFSVVAFSNAEQQVTNL